MLNERIIKFTELTGFVIFKKKSVDIDLHNTKPVQNQLREKDIMLRELSGELRKNEETIKGMEKAIKQENRIIHEIETECTVLRKS